MRKTIETGSLLAALQLFPEEDKWPTAVFDKTISLDQPQEQREDFIQSKGKG